MFVWVCIIIGVLFGIAKPVVQHIQRKQQKRNNKEKVIIDNPINFTKCSWFELEQYYKQMLDVGWYGQLQYIQLARANLLFKEKRWKDCVFYELEHAYLAIQGSGFSKDYKFDDLPRQTSLMFSTKDWDERCEIEFSMLGNFGRAILNANLKEKDLINMFQNSRYKGLPYIIPRQKCIKYIHKNYMELVKETNHK